MSSPLTRPPIPGSSSLTSSSSSSSPASASAPTSAHHHNNSSLIAAINLLHTTCPLVASALVKEYLSSKGLTRTLEAYRLEHLQHQKAPIASSRQELAKQLGIGKLVQQNKAQEQPLKTHLEVIVKSLLQRTLTKQSNEEFSSSNKQSAAAADSALDSGGKDKDHPAVVTFNTPLGGFEASNPRSISNTFNSTQSAITGTFSTLNSSSFMNTSSAASGFSTSPKSTQSTSSANGPPAASMSKQSAAKVSTLMREMKDNLNISGIGSSGGGSGVVGGGGGGSGSGMTGSTSPQAMSPRFKRDSSKKSGASSHTTAPGGSGGGVQRPVSAKKTRNALTTSKPTPTTGISTTSTSRSAKPSTDIEITEEFDDFDDDDDGSHDAMGFGSGLNLSTGGGMYGPAGGVSGPISTSKGALITLQKAWALRATVFASATADETSRGRATFSEEWRGKGFNFNTSVPELGYGLTQVKGGPCGLLAVVQAFVIKHLAFGTSDKIRAVNGAGKLRPAAGQTRQALVEALVEILWQAGGTRNRRAVVAIYKPNMRAPGGQTIRERYIPDKITENMELHEFSDIPSLRDFISYSLDTFTGNEPTKHGLIQLLYSAVLSRGIDAIREEDFDEKEMSLIGRHNYCTQEMINLLAFGQALSNVHDGDINLGGKILKGIKRTCQFGYLSLFEHYGSIKVGEYLKTPSLPIFIICSESHFTVAFSTDKDILLKTSTASPALKSLQSFDLFYYDGLANQDSEIRWTITLGAKSPHNYFNNNHNSNHHNSNNDKTLIPPLEHVLRTRWTNISQVDWNGVEPFL